MKTAPKLAVIAIAAIVSACGEKVSLSTLETYRAIASENGAFNAINWRSSSPYSEYKIMARGDSTQAKDCPQGDGWASVDLVDGDNPRQKVELKCSTYSSQIGCVDKKSFLERKAYASQEGSCSKELSVDELVKIAK